jgi:TolB protein
VSANYLAFGYTGAQAGQIVLRGWLYNAGQSDQANAQVFGKTYLEPLGEDGARKVAHEFAADILEKFGSKSLAGTKIYFTSERSRGIKEIWSVEADGSNQKQLTFYKSLAIMPSLRTARAWRSAVSRTAVLGSTSSLLRQGGGCPSIMKFHL